MLPYAWRSSHCNGYAGNSEKRMSTALHIMLQNVPHERRIIKVEASSGNNVDSHPIVAEIVYESR